MNQTKYQIALLEEMVGKNLYQYCKGKLGEKAAEILNGHLEEDAVKWLQEESQVYRKDNRDNIEFAKSLILDKIILHWIKDYFYKIHRVELELNGCDKDKYLINHKVTCAPDFKLKGDEDIYIEEITNYTGFVKKTGALHLRATKGEYLKRLSKEKKVYLMVLDVPSRSYVLVPMTDELPMYHIEQLASFGGKSAYGLDIGDYPFIPLDDERALKQWVA